MERLAPATDGARPEPAATRDGGSAIARYPGLDGLRGIAILLVLGLHFGFYPSFNSPAPSSIVTRAMAMTFAAGWTGVDLFFVLSGFLITSILLASRNGPRYFRTFYGRRAVRIFPLYYTALIVGLFIAPALFGDRWDRFVGDSWTRQAWLWTYAVNIAFTLGIVKSAGMFGPLWSLAIEEQFYVCWPWIVKYTSRAVLGVVCAMFIVGSLAFRLSWIAQGLPWRGAYYFTLARLDALAVGAGIALLMQDAAWARRLERWAWPGLAVSAAAVAVMIARSQLFTPAEPFVVTFGHSMLAFTFGFLVILGLRDPAPRWLCMPWLAMLGTYSYGIYVWHWFVREIMAAAYAKYPASSAAGGAAAAIAFLIVGVLISLVCGRVSYAVIEGPFLRLKQRFRYTPSDNLRAGSREPVAMVPPSWDARSESRQVS